MVMLLFALVVATFNFFFLVYLASDSAISELGSSPIDVIDPRWELYVLIQKNSDQQGKIQCRLLGFTAIYRFYHYPESSRLRLSQVYLDLNN